MPERPCEPTDDGFINMCGHQGKLYANGVPFSFKGINWYGSEGVNGVIEGLNHFAMSHYFDFIHQQRFNAVRFLFNHKSVLDNAPIPTTIVNPIKNPELISMETGHGVPYMEMIRVTAEAAAEKNVLLVIGAHRLTPDGWPGNGLWYSDEVPEHKVKESWTKLAEQFCGQWNIVAVDLYNEPHKATWGQGVAETRWDLAAKRLGDHVLSKCPRWLVLVEGIATGAPDDGGKGAGYWWGENLVGVRTHPIQLSDPSKLVYAPHTYGPSTYMQSYFRQPLFPKNMPGIWGQHFLDAKRMYDTPFVIGEFGGRGETREDLAWQVKAIEYFPSQDVGMFYFCLNPTSDDTGGILSDDWYHPVDRKLQLLKDLPSTDIAALRRIRKAPYPPRPPPSSPPRSHSPPPPLVVRTLPTSVPQQADFSLEDDLPSPPPHVILRRPSPPPPPNPPPGPPAVIHVLGAEISHETNPGFDYAGRPAPDKGPTVESEVGAMRTLAFVSLGALAALLALALLGWGVHQCWMRRAQHKRKRVNTVRRAKALTRAHGGRAVRSKSNKARVSNADELAQLTADERY